MKVSNVNPVISKIKSNPKLENIKNFTAENKKLIGATTAMAGLMGLAIYAAAAIKPSAVTPDIYNEYVNSGYFFHLPSSTVTAALNITGGVEGMQIFYDYLYF